MGNIITGLDLIRRLGSGAAASSSGANGAGEAGEAEGACFGLTFPLLTKSDGHQDGQERQRGRSGLRQVLRQAPIFATLPRWA